MGAQTLFPLPCRAAAEQVRGTSVMPSVRSRTRLCQLALFRCHVHALCGERRDGKAADNAGMPFVL